MNKQNAFDFKLPAVLRVVVIS